MTWHRWIGRTLSCDECHKAWEAEREMDEDEDHAYSRTMLQVERHADYD